MVNLARGRALDGLQGRRPAKARLEDAATHRHGAQVHQVDDPVGKSAHVVRCVKALLLDSGAGTSHVPEDTVAVLTDRGPCSPRPETGRFTWTRSRRCGGSTPTAAHLLRPGLSGAFPSATTPACTIEHRNRCFLFWLSAGPGGRGSIRPPHQRPRRNHHVCPVDSDGVSARRPTADIEMVLRHGCTKAKEAS